ncbi:hypothetical protein ACFV9C_34910 [Kribbella sp. NPDC059898]|uniref:hypothetical protein n=1 Tax=Kribbella sp. NPDC059898 TaxID=3346995 RepID=UPI0036591C16
MSLLRQAPVPGTRTAALQRIETALESLAPSERRVGEAILADPGSAIALSISEFAELCGVAQPTLSRFAKSIGFKGYPALRLGIAHDFAGDEQASSTYASATGPASSVYRDIRADAALPELADALRDATTVEVWSSAELGAGANLLAAQLRALAVPCAASAVPAHWELRAGGLPAGAVVLLLAPPSNDAVVTRAIERAREAQATIATASCGSGLAPAEATDLVLSLPAYTPSEMLGLWVAEAITDAVREASNIAGPAGAASPWLPWPHRREVFLPTDGDEPIPGVLLFHQTPVPAPSLVLYLTGMNGSVAAAVQPATRDSHIDAAIIAALLNAGHTVLVTDNPAHGARKRQWESPEELIRSSLQGTGDDVLARSRSEATALVDGALALGIIDDPSRLAIVGQSWGGLQALLKMSGDPRIACGVGIMPLCDAAALEPFHEFADAARVQASSLLGPLAATIAPRPLLLISGSDDPTATHDQVDRFEAHLRPEYAAAGKTADLEHIRLAHVAHHFDPGQIEHTIEWLTRSLDR